MLNKDSILNAPDIETEKVSVPEWKMDVYIRTMSGTERDAFEGQVFQAGKVNPENLRAKLLVKVLSDEQGNRLFNDDDCVALGKKSAKVLSRLYEVAQRVNGLTKQDIKELEKN